MKGVCLFVLILLALKQGNNLSTKELHRVKGVLLCNCYHSAHILTVNCLDLHFILYSLVGTILGSRDHSVTGNVILLCKMRPVFSYQSVPSKWTPSSQVSPTFDCEKREGTALVTLFFSLSYSNFIRSF